MIHKVTLTLTTALETDNPEEAKRQALTVFPEDFLMGMWGNLLPFELENIEAVEITEEEFARP